MGALPRSLLTAVRDLAALAVATFVLGGALDAAVMQFDRQESLRHARLVPHSPVDVPFPWGGVLHEDWHWTLAILVWAAACWCAARARSGRSTRWLPAVVAAVLVAARSAAALLPAVSVVWFFDLWPGPVMPYRWDADGDIWISAAHPAWGFPALVVALLVTASVLGARAGRLPDDAASHRVTAVPRSGLPVAAVVVGLPAVGATVATVLVYLALAHDPTAFGGNGTGDPAGELVPHLVTVVAAAALLSGTGTLGAIVTALAALTVVEPPVSRWIAGGGDPLVGLAAAIALVCLVVALWRPCAAWGAEILGPARAHHDEATGVEPPGWDAPAVPSPSRDSPGAR